MSLAHFVNGEAPDQNYWNRVAWQFSPEAIRHGFEGDRSCDDAVVAADGVYAGSDGNKGLAESTLCVLAHSVSDVVVERGNAARESGTIMVGTEGLD